MTHLYVYAAVAGRPAAKALTGVPAMPDGSAPRFLPLDRGVSLIVADVSSSTYDTQTLEARLADLDWVSRAGAAHHAVSDALVESLVVLPFRLFTIFSNEATARATLRESASRIKNALNRVKGRQEWVLRIGCPDPVRREPATGSKVTSPATSGTSFLRAKADARRDETERAARVVTDAAAVFDKLRLLADDAKTRPVEVGTTLLLDAAFLIADEATSAFQQTLTAAAAGLLRDGCPVSLTGPWPPYSFASLD